MNFNPIFFQTLGNLQGLNEAGKLQKLNSKSYLFSDIIKVCIDSEQSTGEVVNGSSIHEMLFKMSPGSQPIDTQKPGTYKTDGSITESSWDLTDALNFVKETSNSKSTSRQAIPAFFDNSFQSGAVGSEITSDLTSDELSTFFTKILSAGKVSDSSPENESAETVTNTNTGALIKDNLKYILFFAPSKNKLVIYKNNPQVVYSTENLIKIENTTLQELANRINTLKKTNSSSNKKTADETVYKITVDDTAPATEQQEYLNNFISSVLQSNNSFKINIVQGEENNIEIEVEKPLAQTLGTQNSAPVQVKQSVYPVAVNTAKTTVNNNFHSNETVIKNQTNDNLNSKKTTEPNSSKIISTSITDPEANNSDVKNYSAATVAKGNNDTITGRASEMIVIGNVEKNVKKDAGGEQVNAKVNGIPKATAVNSSATISKNVSEAKPLSVKNTEAEITSKLAVPNLENSKTANKANVVTTPETKGQTSQVTKSQPIETSSKIQPETNNGESHLAEAVTAGEPKAVAINNNVKEKNPGFYTVKIKTTVENKSSAVFTGKVFDSPNNTYAYNSRFDNVSPIIKANAYSPVSIDLSYMVGQNAFIETDGSAAANIKNVFSSASVNEFLKETASNKNTLVASVKNTEDGKQLNKSSEKISQTVSIFSENEAKEQPASITDNSQPVKDTFPNQTVISNAAPEINKQEVKTTFTKASVPVFTLPVEKATVKTAAVSNDVKTDPNKVNPTPDYSSAILSDEEKNLLAKAEIISIKQEGNSGKNIAVKNNTLQSETKTFVINNNQKQPVVSEKVQRPEVIGTAKQYAVKPTDEAPLKEVLAEPAVEVNKEPVAKSSIEKNEQPKLNVSEGTVNNNQPKEVKAEIKPDVSPKLFTTANEIKNDNKSIPQNFAEQIKNDISKIVKSGIEKAEIQSSKSEPEVNPFKTKIFDAFESIKNETEKVFEGDGKNILKDAAPITKENNLTIQKPIAGEAAIKSEVTNDMATANQIVEESALNASDVTAETTTAKVTVNEKEPAAGNNKLSDKAFENNTVKSDLKTDAGKVENNVESFPNVKSSAENAKPAFTKETSEMRPELKSTVLVKKEEKPVEASVTKNIISQNEKQDIPDQVEKNLSGNNTETKKVIEDENKQVAPKDKPVEKMKNDTAPKYTEVEYENEGSHIFKISKAVKKDNEQPVKEYSVAANTQEYSEKNSVKEVSAKSEKPTVPEKEITSGKTINPSKQAVSEETILPGKVTVSEKTIVDEKAGVQKKAADTGNAEVNEKTISAEKTAAPAKEKIAEKYVADEKNDIQNSTSVKENNTGEYEVREKAVSNKTAIHENVASAKTESAKTESGKTDIEAKNINYKEASEKADVNKQIKTEEAVKEMPFANKNAKEETAKPVDEKKISVRNVEEKQNVNDENKNEMNSGNNGRAGSENQELHASQQKDRAQSRTENTQPFQVDSRQAEQAGAARERVQVGYSSHTEEYYKTVKAPEVMKEITDFISKGETKSIVLKIDPENLGKVKIVVEMTEKMVSANIEVENENVKKAVLNNLDNLKNSLAQNGVQLNSVNVNLPGYEQKNPKQMQPKKRQFAGFDEEEIIDESKAQNSKSWGYNTYEYVI